MGVNTSSSLKPLSRLKADDLKSENFTVSVARGTSTTFRLLAPGESQAGVLSDEGWAKYDSQQRARHLADDQKRRRTLAAEEDRYWAARHQRARELMAKVAAPKVPEVSSTMPVLNPIDRFIRRTARSREDFTSAVG
jgi:hypothetical protein